MRNESISESRADEEDAHDKRRLHKVLSVHVQTEFPVEKLLQFPEEQDVHSH